MATKKGFYTKQNTNEKLAGVKPAEDTKNNDMAAGEPEHIEPEHKRKAGRPTTKNVKNTCRNINVAVPITLLDKWDKVKIVHGNNLTAYVVKLFQKDMDINYDHYKELSDSLKNI